MTSKGTTLDRDYRMAIIKATFQNSQGDDITMAVNNQMTTSDGGWGWLIVVGAFFSTMCSVGFLVSTSVLFVPWDETFDQGKSMMSWVISVNFAVQCIASPIAAILSLILSFRTVSVIGGVLWAAGFMASYKATSITFLVVCIGVVTGIGQSFIYLASLSSVAVYFNKRRSLACGIASAGVGIGCFIMSPLIDYMINEYGWRGAVLLIGAVSLHLCASGLLLKPMGPVGNPGIDREQSLENHDECYEEESTMPEKELLESERVQFDTRVRNGVNEEEITLEIDNTVYSGTAKLVENFARDMKIEITDVNIEEDDGSSMDSSRMSIGGGSVTCLPAGTKFTSVDKSNGCNNTFNRHLKVVDRRLTAIGKHDISFGSVQHLKYVKDQKNQFSFNSLRDLRQNMSGAHHVTSTAGVIRNGGWGSGLSACTIVNSIRNIDIMGSLAILAVMQNEKLVHQQLQQRSEKRKPNTNQELGLGSSLDLATVFSDKEESLHDSKQPAKHGDDEEEQSEDSEDKLTTSNNEHDSISRGKTSACYGRLLEAVRANADLLRDSTFIVFTMCNVLINMSYITPVLFMVDRAIENDIDRSSGAILVSISGAGNVVGRILFGFVADQFFRDPLTCYILVVGVCGISTMLSPLAGSSFILHGIYAFVFGATIGGSSSLIVTVTVALVGLKKVETSLGLLMCLTSIGILIGPPIGGWVFDATQTYFLSYLVHGLFLVVSALMLVPLWLSRRRQRGDFFKTT